MRWILALFVAATVSFGNSTVRADEMKVSVPAGSKVRLKIDPPRKTLLERLFARKEPTERVVVLQAATVEPKPLPTIMIIEK